MQTLRRSSSPFRFPTMAQFLTSVHMFLAHRHFFLWELFPDYAQGRFRVRTCQLNQGQQQAATGPQGSKRETHNLKIHFLAFSLKSYFRQWLTFSTENVISSVLQLRLKSNRLSLLIYLTEMNRKGRGRSRPSFWASSSIEQSPLEVILAMPLHQTKQCPRHSTYQQLLPGFTQESWPRYGLSV